MRTALLLALCLSAAPAAEPAGDPWEAYRAGDLEAALARLAPSLDDPGAAPELLAQGALLQRALGREDAAVALWRRATENPAARGFLWSERGWSELAAGEPARARESFKKAIERSESSATQAEANLGLGLASVLAGRHKEALPPLRQALVQGPYALPLASLLTGRAALGLGDRKIAMTFLRQGAELDPLSLEALRELARAEEREKNPSSARRLHERLSSLDPGDAAAVKAARRLGGGKSEAVARRLIRPLLGAAAKGGAAASGPRIRVALYSDDSGRPAGLRRLLVTSNAPFRLESLDGKPLAEGPGYESWEVTLRDGGAEIELRDSAKNIRYSGPDSVRLRSSSSSGSFLLRDAAFPAGLSIDPGDRELRGDLELRPSSASFRALNELPLEDYLYGVVGSALPLGSPAEAYRAQAVVSRTRALALQAKDAEVCDSSACQRYVGVSAEMRQASEAVAATAGIVLSEGAGAYEVDSHQNCGGMTDDGGASMPPVADGPRGGTLPETPLAVERWTHGFPPAEAYCEASTLLRPVQTRWLRLLDPDDLRRRAKAAGDLGELRAVRPLRRSPSGRLLALELEGSKGRRVVEGFEAMQELLSPGSLRSSLFSVLELRDGRRLTGLLLWGAGTGHGRGLCQAGAIGQAAQGRGWREILKHYFPRLKIKEPPGHAAR